MTRDESLLGDISSSLVAAARLEMMVRFREAAALRKMMTKTSRKAVTLPIDIVLFPPLFRLFLTISAVSG